jgi:mannose-6-phosphate isomerase-like protein (cupin superfamily)
MDPAFDAIETHPENEIFRIVFFPDRIYHARYLSASRSPRYRYDVDEVRNGPDITVMKGSVYLDGTRLASVLRIEYRASRLVELARVRGRVLGERINAWLRVDVRPANDGPADGQPSATVTLAYDRLVDAYAVEMWDSLEPPEGSSHDHRVLPLMGANATITRPPALAPALVDIKAVRRVEVAFSELARSTPDGALIGDVQWDNNFLRSFQKPVTPEPSSPRNTIDVQNYLLDYQRAFFFADAHAVEPVRYRNAMMDTGMRDPSEDNPEARDDNILEMRWLVQRELGGDLVFFHEVTIPPGVVEGTHRHIGSEELYYIVSGHGTVYVGVGDDPATDGYEAVERVVFGIGPKQCRRIPVGPGSMLLTKSGGIHGIRNDHQDEPLKFVAFLYQPNGVTGP